MAQDVGQASPAYQVTTEAADASHLPLVEAEEASEAGSTYLAGPGLGTCLPGVNLLLVAEEHLQAWLPSHVMVSAAKVWRNLHVQ